jgi:nitroreductase
MQPWHFVIVRDKEIKKKIREGAEKEEREFYGNRAPEDWLEALEPLGTDQNKPFLESAPVLIVIFEKKYGEDENGKKIKHYYTKESIGIATGFLIAALHKSGLATLTHTPSPMNFLNDILHRPKNEKPFLILVVGHPAKNAMVPNINKKSLDEISSTF